jgi:K+-transporting ATPase ATPase C chain
MKHLLQSIRLLLVLTVITGAAYPALVTVLSKSMFPRQSAGSLVVRDRQVVGSALLGQRTTSEAYFWPRPSAGDDGTNYVAVPSSASNKGPTSAEWIASVQQRSAAIRTAHGMSTNRAVPADLVLASGSGLDPHISPDAARLQLDRVARSRGLNPEQRNTLTQLVETKVEPPTLGVLGEPRVNVLLLNLALDETFPTARR